MPPRAVPNRIPGCVRRASGGHHGGMRPLASTPRRSAVALALIITLALAACGKSSDTHWNGSGGANTDDGGKVPATVTEPKDAATDVSAAVEIPYQTKNSKSPTVEVTNAGTGTK